MKSHLSSIITAAAVVVAAFILGSAYQNRYRHSDVITVTGLGSKDFTSDLIVWGGSFSRNAMELKQAYAALKTDENAIKAYLNSKGIADSCIVFSSVSMMKNFQQQYDERGNVIRSDFSGYTLTGNVRVESHEIEKVEKLSREITELLENGIELNLNQ